MRSSTLAPVVAQENPLAPAELRFSPDQHFALHGKILMLVCVLSFFLFLSFLVLLPCLRRWRKPSAGSEDPPVPNISPVLTRIRKRVELPHKALAEKSRLASMLGDPLNCTK